MAKLTLDASCRDEDVEANTVSIQILVTGWRVAIRGLEGASDAHSLTSRPQRLHDPAVGDGAAPALSNHVIQFAAQSAEVGDFAIGLGEMALGDDIDGVAQTSAPARPHAQPLVCEFSLTCHQTSVPRFWPTR